MPGSAAGNRSGVCGITRVKEASPTCGSPSCSVLRESCEDEGWRVKDGGWKMKDGGWKMEGRGWRMEDEGWTMKDGGWRMDGGR